MDVQRPFPVSIGDDSHSHVHPSFDGIHAECNMCVRNSCLPYRLSLDSMNTLSYLPLLPASSLVHSSVHVYTPATHPSQTSVYTPSPGRPLPSLCYLNKPTDVDSCLYLNCIVRACHLMLLAYLCEVQSAYRQRVHGLMWSGVEGGVNPCL